MALSFNRRTLLAFLTALSVAVVACDRISIAAANEQGGAYLILELDANVLRHRYLDLVADQMAEALRGAAPTIRYTGRGVVEDHAQVRLVDPADTERALPVLRSLATSPADSSNILVFTTAEDGLIEARLTPSHMQQLTRQATAQSIEVIRRRVDPTGTGGVEIMREGDLRIFVRAARMTNPNELRRSIGITGLLTFHLVREVAVEDAAAGRIPPGTMLAQPYPGIGATAEVIERRPRFTGDRLMRANPSTETATGEFVLAFQLDSEGSREFCSVTREYTGQRFAMLLDNQVLTAPRIKEPICGGSGQITGNFTPESASELALMLNAGALPVPLNVVEEGVLPRE
jgi:preprotein translocase subunit SecD